MLVCGFGMMQQMAASNTIIQTIVEDNKRGRVMSFYAMAFVGMAPFGSLLAGGLAHAVGAPLTVDAERSLLRGGRGLVRYPIAGDPKIDSTYLHRSRHSPGGERSDSGRRRHLKAGWKHPHALTPDVMPCTILAIDSAGSVFNNCFNIAI